MSEIRKRIKLSEIAELLSRGAEQFRKEVIKYAIPHLRLGRDHLFDSEEVIEFLSAQIRKPEEVEMNSSLLAFSDEYKTEKVTSDTRNKSNTSGNQPNKSKSHPNTTDPAASKAESLMSEKEAANFLGVSKMTILRRRKANKIKHYRVGFRVLYSREKHLIPFLEQREK